MKMLKNKTDRHFVSLSNFSEGEIMQLIETALRYKNQSEREPFSDRYAVNCFFEDSTRTHKSFEMAQRKLGMQVIDFQPSTSSVKKGESLYDTVLTLQAIGIDVVVIRHSEEAYYEKLISSPSIHCSIINGGDGAGQHPSQSLLDLMTIYEEFGTFRDLEIAISGDIKHSRVARSNMQILNTLGAKVFFTGPKKWMADDCDTFGSYLSIDELIPRADVMMFLRVQKERHLPDISQTDAKTYLQTYGLTPQREKQMKKQAIVMHPAPVNRGVEIADELVECSRSRIIRQMENGVFARMAIIESVLKK
ncbi:Aspartate carbamoyltransferase [Alkalibacterium sp. AK22]|uniref:aspartate carbamoyltransferase catalytic subunit n=1 Tax=Alkalibacterium sp. AK22 TaxID=1229520 RepID=UPI000446DF47|nr:aspartate carbamoyltransferase catalytic subunit [Alkalibacterium sp. AK22]EXJ24263.1 Aspartate carbamoyltransferase [Alkalibacterium sp. AK22]